MEDFNVLQQERFNRMNCFWATDCFIGILGTMLIHINWTYFNLKKIIFCLPFGDFVLALDFIRNSKVDENEKSILYANM